MITVLNKDKKMLERDFSRYAHLYDRYSNIQRWAARELIKQSDGKDAARILEIGCGTGNYTLLLKKRFKNATLLAVDISGKMVEIAKEKLKAAWIGFFVADAEEMIFEEQFDLITSNAVFQWFYDLEESLAKYKNMLSINGAISFSFFGPRTFWELDSVLKETLAKDSGRISAASFLSKEELEAMLARHFRKTIVKEVVITEDYTTLIELLNKIRYTGARGGSEDNLFSANRGLLKKIEDYYRQKFGGIRASYQLFFCRGRN